MRLFKVLLGVSPAPRWLIYNSGKLLRYIFMMFFCLGCWSAPVTHGHWRGVMSVQPMCNYEGDKICNATIIHLISGDTLPPSPGYSLFLLGENFKAIDPTTFANAPVVDVAGAVSWTDIRDEAGTMITTVPGTVTGLTASLSIESIQKYPDHSPIQLNYPILVSSKTKLPWMKDLGPGARCVPTTMP